jgi:iron(III) transport system substrate-binding protein
VRGLRRISLATACTALLSLTACGGDSGKTELIVYSTHGPDMLRVIESEFEKLHPTVDLQWIDMGSQEVLDRVRSEKANPQADVWYGAPNEIFHTAADQDLLEPSQPSWAAAVAEQSDAQGRYHGIYLTPEVIAYNREAVDSASAPRDWDDVLDPRWKDQVVIRDPLASGTMRTIFGMVIQRSLRETGDTTAGWEWLRRLDAQTRDYVLNPTLLYQKLSRREGVITLWDLPDIEVLRSKTGYPIDYSIPTSGTPMVVDGIAIVKGAQHPASARDFIEFVGSEPAILLAARQFFRLPARADIPADSLPAALRRAREAIRPEPIDWDLLQRQGPDWMRYWDEHVRGGR